MYGIGLQLTSTTTIGGSYSPASLFTANEVGYVYDLNDVTTLFKDTAGTQPVTAAGDAVALRLDKSKNLALGPELVTNGDFSSGAAWTPFSLWAITGGQAVATATAAFSTITQSIALVAGVTYQVTYTVASASAGAVRIAFSGGTQVNGATRSVAGTYTELLVAVTGNNTVFLQATGSGFTGAIDNITVRELAGVHATQSDAAKRPLYSLLPANGVRNLANGSAAPSDVAIWPASTVRNGITATKVGSGFDTDGLPYVDLRFQGTASGTFHEIAFNYLPTPAASGQSWTCSAIMRVIGGSTANTSGLTVRVQELDAADGFIDNSVSDRVTASVDTISISTNAIATGVKVRALVELAFTTATAIDVTYRIKALQFELGSTRTNYQFNYAATNIAQPPFTQVGALLYDGVDDFMVTPAINFAGAEVLGTELVSNGDFSNGVTGWLLIGTNSARAVVAGEMEVTSTAGNFAGTRQTISGLTVGRAYKFSVTARQGTTTNIVRAEFGTTAADMSSTTPATLSGVFVATAPSQAINLMIASAAGVGTAYFDNVSVKEVITPADEIFLCHGVRKLSDAARGVVVELGVGGTNGSFNVEAPNAALGNLVASSRGSALSSTGYAQASPSTQVFAMQAKISTDSLIIRGNGVQQATSASDQGTGNFSNAPIYFGARAGTSLFFKGYEFSSICRSALANPAQIASAEEWVRQRTVGAY